MANINFYLKEPRAKEETLINLQFIFNGQKLKFSTGEKINPKKWNSETHKVRKNFTGSEGLNEYLDKLKHNLKGIFLNATSTGKEVTPEYLRNELLKSIQKDTYSPKGFFDYLNEYYSIKQGKLSRNYLKKIITLQNHLKEFERVKKYKITFSKIDLTFYDLFTSYLLNDKKQLNNTIGGNIAVLKTFLVWATNRGYNSNLKFKDREFKPIQQESEIVYLTEYELMNLFELDLRTNTRLNNVRESFCFACFTGLRFSDVAKIKRENFKGDELQLITTKTRNVLKIPLNDFAKEILIRNNFILPVISNQKTNSYLKELGQYAGIDEPILITKFRGVEAVEFKEPKYNFITSHTARRTFITLSLEKGMRAETVMEMTGHKSYKMFKKYIKITDKIKRIEMKRVWSREPAMKVLAS